MKLFGGCSHFRVLFLKTGFFFLLFCVLGFGLAVPVVSGDEGSDGGYFAPAVHGSEWIRQGTPSEYGPDRIVRYLGIEAELYYPYGVKRIVAASYGKTTNPGMVITVEVFEMGSILDSFGLFSYYRHAGFQTVNVGTEGFFGESQLMFCKDRFFVRLRGTGTLRADRSGLATLANSVAGMIPGTTAKPNVLELVSVGGFVRGSEKYLAQNVLGYPFFNKGLTAEVRVGDQTGKIFVILSPSQEEAETVFMRYTRYLAGAAVQPVVRIDNVRRTLRGQDPVYRNVIVRQYRSFVFGVVDLKDGEKGLPLLEQIEGRLGQWPALSP